MASSSARDDDGARGHGANAVAIAGNSAASTNSGSNWEWKSLASPAKDLRAYGKKTGIGDEGDKGEDKEHNNSSSALGLKLGKRTYFDESSKQQPPPPRLPPPAAAAAAAAAAACNSPPKKGRSSPQAGVTPRCQVEGCAADLSGCKDYHRRHKVCEVHSKTPKNIVHGQEQRFCQQCSKFHLLTEFDEGKRSCRRRLAGHNERRRKPQPDAFAAAYGMANSNLQAAYQRLNPSIIVDGNGFPRSSWGQLGNQITDAEKLLLLLQNTKRSAEAAGAISGSAAASAKKEQMGILTLSSSSSPVGSGGGNSGGAIDPTSRALSLLSAEPWSSSSTATSVTTVSTTAYHHHNQVHHHHHHQHHQQQQQRQQQQQQDYLMMATAPSAVVQAQDAIPLSSTSRAYASSIQQRSTSIDLSRQPPPSFDRRL